MRREKVVVLEEYKQRRKAYFKYKRKQTMKQLIDILLLIFILSCSILIIILPIL